MSCHTNVKREIQDDGKLKLLLMGNPNVGKSVVFSKLTGMHVDSSNYVGTTVDYTVGDIKFGRNEGIMIDVPGIYSLEATSDAEQVAVGLLEAGADVIICVLDATHLERNLDLAFKLKEYPIPVVYSLNLLDVAERQGITIDVEKLSQQLGSPVIPTIAVRNTGLMELMRRAIELAGQEKQAEEALSDEERWNKIKDIVSIVETKVAKEKETFVEKLEEWTLEPWPGIPIAIFVLLLSLGLVVGGGKALRAVVLLPLVRQVIVPFLAKIISAVIPAGIFRNVLVGQFGILSIGIEWPFALILPYVLLFYVVFSFLEDSGYLPRIGVLADGLLRKIGIQGGNIIPMMLGYGCAVPAILGTRAANTYKERITVATLVSFAIPCASQSGAFIALLGDKSILALVFVYSISVVMMLAVGLIMNKMIKGPTQPMLLEVPNLLLPNRDAFKTKLKLRMKHFLIDAEGPMLAGIAIAAVIAETGILNQFSILIGPFVEGWLGLPKESSLALLLGIIRKELAVLPLLELSLSTLQLVVGSVLALFYLPCLSVFGVIAKEFSLKTAITIALVTTGTAFLFAGIVNQIGQVILGII